MINVPDHIDSLDILNKRIKHLEELGRITVAQREILKDKIENIRSLRNTISKSQNNRHVDY
jgi:hypothetical protein